MPDEPVDGFTDVEPKTKTQDAHDASPGSPDPGVTSHLDPLSPDERAKLEKEIDADQKKDSERLHNH